MPCGCGQGRSLPLSPEQIAQEEARAERRRQRVDEIARKREAREQMRQEAVALRRQARLEQQQVREQSRQKVI